MKEKTSQIGSIVELLKTEGNTTQIFKYLLYAVTLSGLVVGCTISKLTWEEPMYQRMGWISVLENDPSAVSGYQRLQDEMKVSPDIRNFVATKGLPNYLKFTADFLFPELELIYCKEGIIYQFSSVIPRNFKHKMKFSDYVGQLPSCTSILAYNSRTAGFSERDPIDNTNSGEDPLIASVESDYMRNSIWHIDFMEIDSKPIPTSSISYVDRKGITNIASVGAAPSPNSSWFAVVEVHNKEMALILKSNDKTVQQKVLYKTAIGERLWAWPAWSPSGEKIAILHGQFDSKRQRFSHSIIIADINGSKISRHTLPEGTLNFPLVMAPFNKMSWSPDGKKILISWDKARVLNVDTGNFSRISDGPIIAEWSPNSSSVYYFEFNSEFKNRGLKNFYKRDLDSAKPIKLADESDYKQNGLRHSSCTYGHLSLSPSGSKLMFAGGSDNQLEDVIHVYNIERNKPIDILKPLQRLPLDAIIITTQWAPDEKNIVILAVRVKPSMELTVELLSLETQKMKTITKIDLPKNVSETEIIDLIGTIKSLDWTQ